MVKRVTIRKEGSHYVVSVGGRGMTLAYTKAEANRKAKAFRNQLKKKKTIRRRKTPAMRVGTIRWDSYKPGRDRLYQLQKVVNKHGGVSALSGRMKKREARCFAEGYNRGKGKRGKRIPLP